jgi:hypothetical protein
MTDSTIDWKAPASNFVYFLVLGFLLALIGAKYSPARETVGGFINDQISGVTILAGLLPVALLILLVASKKLHTPSRHHCLSATFVVAPTNFLVTATAVAAALNWAIFFALYLATPDVTRGDVAAALACNALEITAIAIASYSYASVLLNHSERAPSSKAWFFWVVFVGAWIVAAGLVLRIVQLSIQAAT